MCAMKFIKYSKTVSLQNAIPFKKFQHFCVSLFLFNVVINLTTFRPFIKNCYMINGTTKKKRLEREIVGGGNGDLFKKNKTDRMMIDKPATGNRLKVEFL